MGWSDEAFRDADDVLGEGTDAMYVSGSLGREQFDKLIAHGGYPKLADYLHAAYPGTKFIAAGQKNYAVYSSNGPTGDISVTFSGRNAGLRRRRREQLPQPDGLQRPRVHHSTPRLRPLLRRRRVVALLRHGHDLAGLDVPARRQPLRARHATRRTSAATRGSPTPAWR